MDARAGAPAEAEETAADLALIQHGLTHTESDRTVRGIPRGSKSRERGEGSPSRSDGGKWKSRRALNGLAFRSTQPQPVWRDHDDAIDVDGQANGAAVSPVSDVFCNPTVAIPEKYTSLKICVSSTDSRLKRRHANRRMTSAGIKARQNEASYVFTSSTLSDRRVKRLFRRSKRPKEAAQLSHALAKHLSTLAFLVAKPKRSLSTTPQRGDNLLRLLNPQALCGPLPATRNGGSRYLYSILLIAKSGELSRTHTHGIAER